MKLRFGTQDQVSFRDSHEYYYALGFLANTRNAEIRWEHNEDQGAWGSEGRIHCLVPDSQFPQNFRFTAGRGSVYARINCNEYVGTLVTEHNFKDKSKGQKVDEILATVPDQYQEDFISGYGQKIIKVPYSPPKTSLKIAQVDKPTAVRPIVKKSEPPKDDYVAPNISLGDTVYHKTFGTGKVTSIEKTIIKVSFAVGEKPFQFPNAFKQGFLKL